MLEVRGCDGEDSGGGTEQDMGENGETGFGVRDADQFLESAVEGTPIYVHIDLLYLLDCVDHRPKPSLRWR